MARLPVVRPSRLRRVLRVATALAVVALVAFLLTPMGRYLVRAAWEEGWILARRRSIESLLASPNEGGTAGNGAGQLAGPPVGAPVTLTAAERGRLQLVLEARRYAVEVLRLTAGESFTQYSRLRRDTLVLVLSAARRDTLAPHTWWFPVVGRFPYKGFFDFGQAQRTAERLQREGYDTYLRPASAFSTLGWFNDPLLSTTLRLDSLDLVDTIIHELTHNTVFVRNQVAFNESFASFVGAHGAQGFFRARGDVRSARALAAAWRDEKLLGAFWGATLAAVDSAYRAHPGDSAGRVAARDTVFARMRQVLLRDLAPRLPAIPRERLQRLPLDNASLLARQVYSADPWLFEAIHDRTGRSLPHTIALVTRLVRDDQGEGGGTPLDRDGAGATAATAALDDPFARLRRWLEAPAASGAPAGVGDSVGSSSPRPS
jgi:predicted aminopeptidase